MKIEKVENHKIKVTLSESDLMYYNLNPKQMTKNSPELHRFLFQIMENVKNQTGFNPYCGQVAVEAVSSESGMTLIISRISPTVSKSSLKKVKASAAKRVLTKNRYYFDSFDDLCSALCALEPDALSVSTLYECDGSWYLILGSCRRFDRQHCILSEYCTDFGGKVLTEAFLSEHGRMIADGEKLISMANGIKELEK